MKTTKEIKDIGKAITACADQRQDIEDILARITRALETDNAVQSPRDGSSYSQGPMRLMLQDGYGGSFKDVFVLRDPRLVEAFVLLCKRALEKQADELTVKINTHQKSISE